MRKGYGNLKRRVFMALATGALVLGTGMGMASAETINSDLRAWSDTTKTGNVVVEGTVGYSGGTDILWFFQTVTQV